MSTKKLFKPFVSIAALVAFTAAAQAADIVIDAQSQFTINVIATTTIEEQDSFFLKVDTQNSSHPQLGRCMVTASYDAKNLERLSAKRVMCITQDHQILESNFSADIKAVEGDAGTCLPSVDKCTSLSVVQGKTLSMTLTKPLTLSGQARNEVK